MPRMARFFLWTLLLAALAAPAMAQVAPLNCSAAAATQPTLRAEGIAELVGDVIITCSGAAPVPRAGIQLTFATTVTSRVLVPSATLPQTESVLLIDDPAPAQQVPCLATPPNACLPTDNVIQGVSQRADLVTFFGVPLNATGASRTFRIKNVRVNAQLIPDGAPVNVVVAVQPEGAQQTAPVTPNLLQVGLVRRSLAFDVRSITDVAPPQTLNFVACTGNNNDLAANPAAQYSVPGGRSFHVRFTETFATAFKRRNIGTTVSPTPAIQNQNNPAEVYNTETGFFNANLGGATGLNRAGLADSGTRLRVVFNNVPANVRIFVTTREVSPGSTPGIGGASTRAQLVQPTGAFTPIAADSSADGGLRLVPAGTEAVWEILDTDVQVTESVSFGVALAYSSSPQPAAGTATVLGSYAPLSSVISASPTDPLPRFASLLPVVNAFSISPCRTTLLFQFVSNQAGFDTGVAVTNTSRDTLGTSAQSGRCTATLFPTPATASANFPPFQSNVIAGGEQWAFTISSVRPGFQGYMMVTCDFQFAHGYAFISDVGAQRLAQGYQALVIPDRPRVADPMSTSVSGTGEQLVH